MDNDVQQKENFQCTNIISLSIEMLHMYMQMYWF